jgi:hypothetical protein
MMDVIGTATPDVGDDRAAELVAIGRRLSLDEAVTFATSSDELPPPAPGSP